MTANKRTTPVLVFGPVKKAPPITRRLGFYLEGELGNGPFSKIRRAVREMKVGEYREVEQSAEASLVARRIHQAAKHEKARVVVRKLGTGFMGIWRIAPDAKRPAHNTTPNGQRLA